MSSLRYFFDGIIILALAMVYCTSSVDVSEGGGSGTIIGMCTIQGTVKDTLDQPHAGSLVRLRPFNYIAGGDSSGIVKRNVYSDDAGRFLIEYIPAGRYSIEFLDADSLGQMITCIIDSLDSIWQLPPVMVGPMSTIVGLTGLLGQQPYEGTVQAIGLERMATIDSNGNFSLQVPAGWCRLNLHGVDSARPDFDTIMFLRPGPNEMMRPSQEHSLPCEELPCELSAIVELLDTNDIDAIDPESVVTIENGHVTELRLRGLGLHMIPESIFRIMFVRTIDLGENELRELPRGIDRFRHLETLIADGNALWTIDAAIGNCDLLQRLDLSDNRLQSLPEPITYLKLASLDLSGNMLCNLGETTRIWIGRYDPDWNDRQNCY